MVSDSEHAAVVEHYEAALAEIQRLRSGIAYEMHALETARDHVEETFADSGIASSILRLRTALTSAKSAWANVGHPEMVHARLRLRVAAFITRKDWEDHHER